MKLNFNKRLLNFCQKSKKAETHPFIEEYDKKNEVDKLNPIFRMSNEEIEIWVKK